MSDKETLLEQLQQEGSSEEVIKAFAKVDRTNFIPGPYKEEAYRNVALPIGYDQTVSQPSTIAFMLDKLDLRGGQKILEVGAGSGYVLALIEELVKDGEIYGTERVSELVDMAQNRLKHFSNIQIFHTPTELGLAEHAPFDRILVSAAASGNIPQKLIDQLREGGVMVCPVDHSIIRVEKSEGGHIAAENYPGFAFVPLIMN
jgi:protein-L-isoaspartate(D-aspartate) O-methyltransferase